MDSTFHYSEWIGQCFRIKAQQKLSQRSFYNFVSVKHLNAAFRVLTYEVTLCSLVQHRSFGFFSA